MATPRTALRRARTLIRKVRKTGPIEWRAYTQRLPVRRDLVMYESFAGNGMLCNPEAIFRALLADPEQQHLTHVWALRNPKDYADTVREFEGDPRVKFVKYRSPSYFKTLSTAGLLFNNATFPPEFRKREGQVYVNTWHGTPLKVMGYDEPSGIHAARNTIRNFVMADYLLSASDFMTEQMYEQAYRLYNVFEGQVLQEGYPRVDRQQLGESERAAVRRRLARAGVSVGPGRVVLYAPTWHGTSFYSPTNDALLLGERVRALREALGSDCTVLLKVHQQVYTFATEHPDLRPVLVPNEIATNEVLGLTDVLVTDYSSIFFDFLATGRPIVYFTPDLQQYTDDRGLYLDPDTLPGPRVETVSELIRVLRSVGTGEEADPLVTHATAYAEAVQRFAPHEDGKATQRVLDVVVRGRTEGANLRRTRRDGREKLLVFTGGMKSNGITTSALNLLHNIDHDRFDVSVVFDYSRRRDRWRNAQAIDPRVRRFARVGTFSPGKLHRRRRRELLSHGAAMSTSDLQVMMELLKGEWSRIFGACRFDYIVDFSGYAPFWTFLMAESPAKSRSIWLHNDLRADQMREIDGRRPHEKHLGAVFSSYRYYDHLVSVSEALNDINSSNLTEFAPPGKFTWARNTIDHERILRMAHGDREALQRWSSDPVLSTLSYESLHPDTGFDVGETMESLGDQEGLEGMREEIDRRITIAQVVPPLEGVRTFVTVGRLSPEKNHERLLRAFDLVHQEDPATRLIVVGDGPLRSQLQQLAIALGLDQAVTFAGLQRNPYAIMAQSDFFVLSSDYEGQPMVILEARVLGLPVVATRFGSVAGSVPPEAGIIVERSHEALAEGMRTALRGELGKPTFDPVEYNRLAVGDFYRAIGADPA